MLKENRFTRYTLYAIGEIALVMIGILLALQVNNWNELRKTKDLEISTLMELKSNLSADIHDYREDMRVYDIAAHSSEIIIDFIDGKIPYHDSLNIHFGKIPVQGVFAPNKAAYENLKIMGVKLISNDSLRSSISDLYEGRYHYMEKYMETEYLIDRQQFGELYLKVMREYSFYKNAKPIDPGRIIGNQDFRNLIAHRKSKIQGWFKVQYELNIKRATQLIDLIDQELEKKRVRK
jgi:hypothetical protein